MWHRRAMAMLGTLAVSAVAIAAEAAEADAELQAVCERLKSGSNRYFSESFVAELRAQLEEKELDLETRTGLEGVLGRELLRLGDVDGAIERLGEAHRKAREHRLSDGLRSAAHWQLALAYLQRAEDQNCIAHRSADSCLLPITAGGVHSRPEPARTAGDLLLSYAERHPRNLQAVWLLNLARRLSGDFPQGVPERLRLPDSALAAESGFAPWRDRAAELGVNVDDLAGGAVMDDFDGDGLLDLVSSTWDPCGPLTAFRNDGEGGFEEVTAAWGLDTQLGGLNLLHADFDGDGRLDLLVLRGAWLLGEGRIRNSLLRNVAGERGPSFVDVTHSSGLAEPAYPTQTAAWADFDRDGDLDLFVGNEATRASPYPSQLFRNDGDGTFTDVAAEAGVTNLRYAKGTAWGDYDNDGDPDLYVSNFGENRLYRNETKANEPRFVDVATELGLVEPRVESFGTWFFDFDNDGDLDLFVADYRSQALQVTASYFGISSEEGQPLLYRNDLVGEESRGYPAFTEVSRKVGITRPAMPMGANYGDLDNDGWLDLYLGTGEPDLASIMPNQMVRNLGGGFVEVSFAGRFAHLQKGHGVAFGDLDNDGDQDLFHQLGGFYPVDSFGNALFENPLGESDAASVTPHWVTLRLEARGKNRFAIGARIEIVLSDGAGGRRWLHRLVSSGGSFGGSSLQQEIGLGSADRILELLIRWPGSGAVSSFSDLAVDRVYRVVEGAERMFEVAAPRVRLGGESRGPAPAVEPLQEPRSR